MIRNKTVVSLVKGGLIASVGILVGSYVERNYHIQSELFDQNGVTVHGLAYVNCRNYMGAQFLLTSRNPAHHCTAPCPQRKCCQRRHPPI